MFTYKFLGLDKGDAETPYYYGSLPKRAKVGQSIEIVASKNRYRVTGVQGEGLEGRGGLADQRELALADIGAGKPVPTLQLRKIAKRKKPKKTKYAMAYKIGRAEKPAPRVIKAEGRTFDPDNMKDYSRTNRKIRLSGKG